jgi:outer membrane protein TolC
MREGRCFLRRPLERRRRLVLLALPLLWLPLLRLAPPAGAQPSSTPSTPPGLALDEAVRLTLEHDPLLAVERAGVRAARGALLASRASFDPVFLASVSEIAARDPLSETTSGRQDLLGNSLLLTKRFRSGLSIEPGLEVLRTEDGGDPTAVNIGTFSLTMRQPLLRGRGRDALAVAAEAAAARDLAATSLDLGQTTAERLFAVASQYWIARSAALNLDVLRESEDRARGLLATTRQLIAADVTPAAELVQVEANLAAKEAATIGGERALFEARQDLGREIGLEPAAIAALPLPADPFPAVPAAALASLAFRDRFVAAALERRPDLLAARERGEAADLLLRAADNSLLPQLDLVFTPSYSGLVEGTDFDAFYSPLYQNVPGASSSLSLTLSWPARNSRSRGELERAEAAREQTRLLLELQARQIGADVPTALEAVERQAAQVERAEAAVRLFEKAVENEERKLRAGTSTIIDLISQRDRLTGARQAQVSAQLALALALARLRFETGTLVDNSGGPGAPAARGTPAVAAARLTTVPFHDGEEAP